MLYHQVTEKIKSLLTSNNFWFETFEHEEVKTSEEASRVRPGYTLHQGAKALIVKADKKFAMLVFPADLRMSSKKVKMVLHIKSLRFATPEEIEEITSGVQVGAVPPFGNLFNLPVYVDKRLFENEKIVFNAGDRRLSIAMKSEDYKSMVNPTVGDIIE